MHEVSHRGVGGVKRFPGRFKMDGGSEARRLLDVEPAVEHMLGAAGPINRSRQGQLCILSPEPVALEVKLSPLLGNELHHLRSIVSDHANEVEFVEGEEGTLIVRKERRRQSGYPGPGKSSEA